MATTGGSSVMYNLSSLASTKPETDDSRVYVVQVSKGWVSGLAGRPGRSCSMSYAQ